MKLTYLTAALAMLAAPALAQDGSGFGNVGSFSGTSGFSASTSFGSGYSSHEAFSGAMQSSLSTATPFQDGETFGLQVDTLSQGATLTSGDGTGFGMASGAAEFDGSAFAGGAFGADFSFDSLDTFDGWAWLEANCDQQGNSHNWSCQ